LHQRQQTDRNRRGMDRVQPRLVQFQPVPLHMSLDTISLLLRYVIPWARASPSERVSMCQNTDLLLSSVFVRVAVFNADSQSWRRTVSAPARVAVEAAALLETEFRTTTWAAETRQLHGVCATRRHGGLGQHCFDF
jgi:hypothetical protein